MKTRTDLAAWKALQAHASHLAPHHLRDLFGAAGPARFSQLSVTAVNPQAAMAATIDFDVPSKKALTSTITAAPVQSCSVPISADAVPA